MAGITSEAVFTAADRHYRETGRIPSKEQIREALGHTGSFATIQRHLADWRDTLPSRLTFKLDVPDAPPAFEAGCRNIWLLAVEEAGNQAKQALAPLKAEIQAKDSHIEELMSDLKAAQTEAEQAKLDALRAIEAAEARALAASQRAGTLQQLYQEREARIKELEAHTATLQSELQAQNASHKADLEKAYSRAEETENRLIKQIETERTNFTKYQDQSEKQLLGKQAALETLHAAHESKVMVIQTLESELGARERALASEQEKIALLQESLQLKDALIAEMKSQRKAPPSRKPATKRNRE